MVHFLCSCLHVGTVLGLSRLMLDNLENFVARKAPQQQQVVVEVLLRPALGPCWAYKTKHEKGVWGFMVHCWALVGHVGTSFKEILLTMYEKRGPHKVQTLAPHCMMQKHGPL